MSAQMAGLLVLAVSIAPSGLCLPHNTTHGWRRGLHSYAGSRLAGSSPTRGSAAGFGSCVVPGSQCMAGGAGLAESHLYSAAIEGVG
jgi:hypothetical protein